MQQECSAMQKTATDPVPVVGSESSAAAAPAEAAPTSVAMLALHTIRDGELVLLILRPSRWFILLSSLRFLAVVAIFMILAVIFDEKLLHTSSAYVEAGAFLMAARLMWGVLHWMSRLYILTDYRILRLSGIFHIDIFDCPLRRVARTMLDITFQERLCRIGSIVIIPQDDEKPLGVWQMVSRPRRIHEQIQAAIARAKQGSER